MKKILYSVLFLFIVLIACSKEEELTPTPTPKFTVSISAGAGGSVSTEGGTYDQGSKFSVTATPNGEFLFNQWSDGNTDNPREITATSNLSISANFIKKTYALAIIIDGEGTVEEEIIVQGSTSTTEYNSGTIIKLTATPSVGWIFSGWSGAIYSSDNPIEISVDEAKEVTANFTIESFLFVPSNTLYPTALQNHQWNTGWVTYEGEKLGGFPDHPQSAVTYIDIDGDGDLDITYRSPNNNSGYRMMVMINNGDEFEIDDTRFPNHPHDRDYRKMVPVDVDNDGDLDLIGFNAADPKPQNPLIPNETHGGLDLMRFSDGKFYFEEIQNPIASNEYYFHGGTAGDINGDGWVDVITGHGGKIYLNDGAGNISSEYEELMTMEEFQQETGKLWFAMELIDVNNDGYQDLIAGEAWGVPSDGDYQDPNYQKTKNIYFGKAGYPYFEKIPYALETEYDLLGQSNYDEDALSATLGISVIDFDNDGDLDILTFSHNQSTGGALEYFENIGNSQFRADNSIFGNGENILSQTPNWIKTWDIDGDGIPEILNEASSNQGYNYFRKESDGKYYKNTKFYYE